MTLVWDNLAERAYETGVDHGVLYYPDGGGVVWNGLVEVEEHSTAKTEPVYFDGVKFNDIVAMGDFSATLKAYTYPEEFLEFEGVLEDQTGVYMMDQPPQKFHLSYRTRVGNFVDGHAKHYKLHLLWNLTAVASDKVYTTLSLDVEPNEFEWELSAVPEEVSGFRPTAHLVIDSRRVDPMMLSDIETILYGDVDSPPRMPSLKGLTSFIRKWDRLIIVDNGDGTWTAISKDPTLITIDEVEQSFTIESENVVWIDAETYQISSSEKNEEDIF